MLEPVADPVAEVEPVAFDAVDAVDAVEAVEAVEAVDPVEALEAEADANEKIY